MIWLHLPLGCSSDANFEEACTQLQKKLALGKGERWGMISCLPLSFLMK